MGISPGRGYGGDTWNTAIRTKRRYWTGSVEEDRDCSEVLVQIAAVRTAVNNVGRIILLDHINHCIVHAVENGDQKALDDLNTAVNRFVK